MRRGALSARLALTGMRKNGQTYLPYLLSCAMCVAMFYDMIFLAGNEMLPTMPGGGTLASLLGVGSWVVGFFAVLIVFYANRFLMKRRRKELGLYNILGLEKRHVALVLCWETLYLALISILAGLALGLLLSKLILLLLLSLLRFPVQMGFSVSVTGLSYAATLFGAIFGATLVDNLLHLRLASPLALLRSDEQGEREPKSRWGLTVLGLLTLGGGYLMANLVQDTASAIVLFFVAVTLVIIGTECLFVSGSIVVLKRLRANKRYYYQPRHFISVSGMLYRMKQNGRGLAHICILCTMVLVAVSTTVSLYVGTEASLRGRFPTDVRAEYQLTADGLTPAEARAKLEQVTTAHGLTMLDPEERTYFTCGLYLTDAALSTEDGAEWRYLTLITAAEYDRLSGESTALAADQVLCTCPEGVPLPDEFTFAGVAWQVAGRPARSPLQSEDSIEQPNAQFLVLADEAALQTWMAQVQAAHSYPVCPTYELRFDLDGTDADKVACADEIAGLDGFASACRQREAESFYVTYGGFLFLGLFLGLIFLLATTLIIYYKQLSEGYQDRRRFEIMRQVGMSAAEVRQSVAGQIRLVFFLPLVVAGLHVFAAFHMIGKMLLAFSLNDPPLFALCTLGTLLVFSLVYLLVYRATARAYYRIVNSAA